MTKHILLFIFNLIFFNVFGQIGVYNLEYQKRHSEELNKIELEKKQYYYKKILSIKNHDSLLLENFKKVDLGSLFVTENYCWDGIIGEDYKRLRIWFHNAIKSENDSLLYSITGKTKVNTNICEFSGTFRLIKAVRDTIVYEDGPPYLVSGFIYGTFELNENKSQIGSGVFKGDFFIKWTVNNDTTEIILGDIDYVYRESALTFSGTWESYKTAFSKRICWSNYIPYCLPKGFNCSDGPAIIPCKEFAKNGWETLNEVYDFSNETKRKEAARIENEEWWK